MSITTESPKLLTVQAALDRLNSLGVVVSIPSMRRWVRDKRLPFFRIGRKFYIDEGEIVQHVRKLQLAAVRDTNKEHGRNKAEMGVL